MDGGYKQYYFNNIAWGKSNDPFGPLGNCSAFQEIHGFLATVFNNTAYNFVIGSRRQAPEAGRNKYLGNIWQSIGEMVFRHANPSNAMADPNAADAGRSQIRIRPSRPTRMPATSSTTSRRISASSSRRALARRVESFRKRVGPAEVAGRSGSARSAVALDVARTA